MTSDALRTHFADRLSAQGCRLSEIARMDADTNFAKKSFRAGGARLSGLRGLLAALLRTFWRNLEGRLRAGSGHPSRPAPAQSVATAARCVQAASAHGLAWRP